MLRLAALMFSTWVLLSGCGGPIHSYSKPGSSSLDFRRDSDACVQDSRAGGGSTIRVTDVSARREVGLYHRCMEARGWTAD